MSMVAPCADEPVSMPVWMCVLTVLFSMGQCHLYILTMDEMMKKYFRTVIIMYVRTLNTFIVMLSFSSSKG